MSSKVFSPMIFYVKTGSRLTLNLPRGRAGVTITSVSSAYKEGTYHTTKLSPRGTVSISRTTEYVAFDYIDNTGSIGFDNIEILVRYSDGQEYLRVVRVFNSDRGSNPNSIEYYNHRFYTYEVDTSSTFNLTAANSNSNLIPTVAEIIITDSKYNQSLATVKIDRAISTFTIEHNGVLMDITPTIINVPIGSGSSIKGVISLNVRYYTDIPNTTKTIYAKVVYYNIINRATTEITDNVITYNQAIHTFDVNRNNRYSETSRPPYVLPSDPNFVENTIPQPSAAMSVNITKDRNTKAPNIFNGTTAHVANSNDNSNIRVGQNVPDNAVSLGYYQNTTSSLENMISLMESSADIKSIKKAERWFYRYNMKEKDEGQFEDTVEFNGVDGTEYEGYWGILYKDLVVWEEDVEWDRDPQFITYKKEYDGLTEQKLPIYCDYEANGKAGKLTLTNAIYLPSYTEQDPNDRTKTVNTRYKAIATYEGVSVNDTIVYSATIRYSGTVIKRDGLSNLEPDDPSEILMYPDDNGLLLYNNDIYVNDDSFYITDKFKDDTPLYYRYRLKNKVYYTGNSSVYGDIKLTFKNGNQVDPKKYKHIIELVKTNDDNVYYVDIYTDFIPNIDNSVYASYPSLSADMLSIDKNTNERLSVIPAFDTSLYDVLTMQDVILKSSIVLKEPEMHENETAPISITYRIVADKFKSRPYTVSVVNKESAFSNQLDKFKGDNYIISDNNNIGFMTAKTQLMLDLTDEEISTLNDDTIYSVVFDTDSISKNDVVMFTDPSGDDLIFANTIVDTSGSIGHSIFLDKNGKYVVDTKIRKVYAVMCRNISSITIAQPRDMNRLKGWFPNIRYAYFNKLYERIDNSIRLVYSIPEFHTQIFGKYGRPYMDVEYERAIIIGDKDVMIRKTPLYVKVDDNFKIHNLFVWKENNGYKKSVKIKSFNFLKGVIELEESISDNDIIYVSYTYEESYYKYTGYYDIFRKTESMISLNLNPLSYFTYTKYEDGVPEKKPVYDLFNKTIFFYMRPMRVIKEETQEVIRENKYTIYHKVNDPSADEPFDVNIGRIFMRHHASLLSTELIDTRVRGGGILESISDELRRKLEPESDYYLDISTMNGEPYQQNSVLIFKIDARILKNNGGRFNHEEIETIISKWSAAGTLPLIEYIENAHISPMEEIKEEKIILKSKSEYFEFL